MQIKKNSNKKNNKYKFVVKIKIQHEKLRILIDEYYIYIFHII